MTRVVSAMDGDNRFDFNLTATWIHDVKSAFVKRELQSKLAPDTEIIKDLQFAQTRDILNLRADVGILWDVGLHIDLPLVLSDASSLDFDRSESDCIYPDPEAAMGTRPDLRRRFELHHPARPDPARLPDRQLGPGRGTQPPVLAPCRDLPGPANVFKGPSRKGFENLGVGITWAPFNQARDDTKPTWTLNFDAKLDIFKDKRFDPGNPNGNIAVGLGYHQFVWSTLSPSASAGSIRTSAPGTCCRCGPTAARSRTTGHADQREPAAAGGRHDRRRADRLGEPARRPARHRRGPRPRRASTSSAASAARSGSRLRAIRGAASTRRRTAEPNQASTSIRTPTA